MFQVGGDTGSAIGPLLAALVIVPPGQHAVAWFALFALLGIVMLSGVSRWYAAGHAPKGHVRRTPEASPYRRKTVLGAIAVLLVLIFSKYVYIAGLSTFYLTEKFGLSVRDAQLHLFVFLFAAALGTLLGGPVGAGGSGFLEADVGSA